MGINLLKRFSKKLEVLKSPKSFALNQLDLKLASFLKKRNGFFVEAGANDGISQTNTLFFEKYRSWRGLLIEPIPDLSNKCRVNRPQCIVENCALVPFDFKGSHIEMRYSNLMSLVKGAMKSEQEELAHIERGCELQNVQTYTVEVPVKTLTSVLETHAIEKIDLLSLDVEGFELSVLKGIDFDRYKPDWILVEARYRDEIDTFLQDWYEPVAELSHHDVLYRNLKS